MTASRGEAEQFVDFEAFFEAAPDALIVVDSEGCITHLNHQAEVLFGYQRTDLGGESIERLIPQRFRDAHVHHRSQYVRQPRVRPMGATLELFGQRGDGTEFPVDIMLSPLPSPPGSVMAVVRDVTDRKAQEQALRQTTEMFERLYENAPDSVVVVDPGGEIVRVNSQTEKTFQYDRRELIGSSIELLLPRRLRDAHVHHRDRYFRQVRVRPMGAGLTLSGLRKDGTEFPVDIMLSPVETSEGVTTLAVVRDITERKQAEEQHQMREALRQKDLLLQEIHHRVKNNLQLVSSLLTLQGQRVEDRQVLDMFEDTRSRVRAMALLHDKLYRSEDKALIDFSDYLRDLVGNVFGFGGADTRGITVDLDVNSISLPMDAAIPCGLIVNELMTNVLKHAFPHGGGHVRVQLSGDEHGFAFSVTDDGVGMKQDVPLEEPETLGLQILQSVSQQLKGTYRVTSGPEGTTVQVKIPLERDYV